MYFSRNSAGYDEGMMPKADSSKRSMSNRVNDILMATLSQSMRQTANRMADG